MVTPAEIDAQLEAAEAEFDRQEAEAAAQREAEQKAKEEEAAALAAQHNEVLAMDPQPAVVHVDGVTHFRWESGAYVDEQEDAGDENASFFYDDLAELVESANGAMQVWPSIEAWAGAMAAEMDEAA
jgi:hypothetical protein